MFHLFPGNQNSNKTEYDNADTTPPPLHAHPPGQTRKMKELENIKYAGFWIRFVASIIDTILVLLITFPPLIGIYGIEYFNSSSLISGVWDFLLSWVLPAVAVIIFWVCKSATPGKMLTGIKIVDGGFKLPANNFGAKT